jgi:2-polyprenyl-6-methoxyphenol hydroxylase-like FAD-dependent oxidoreductase
MRERYDVIVVGARVGGSALAALLGDQGVCVLLLDRARFPSTTSSTHFFRGAGMVGVLQRLGVLDAVLDLGCPPLMREFNYTDGGAEPAEGPPRIQAGSGTASRYAGSRST